jgi:hypothetical protein
MDRQTKETVSNRKIDVEVKLGANKSKWTFKCNQNDDAETIASKFLKANLLNMSYKQQVVTAIK